MKAFITPSYTFNASAKTVDLTGIVPFDIKRLVAIINQDTGDLIYSTAVPALKYTAVSTSLVTLSYDTTAMSNTDRLQIIYDLEGTNALADAQPVYLSGIGLTPYARLTSIATGGVAQRLTYDGGTPSTKRKRLVFRAHEDNTGNLYYGGSDVDSTDGFKLMGVETYMFEDDLSDYYIVGDTTGDKFYIQETRY